MLALFYFMEMDMSRRQKLSFKLFGLMVLCAFVGMYRENKFVFVCSVVSAVCFWISYVLGDK